MDGLGKRKMELYGIEKNSMNQSFYKDRTVLVTGHTGFKGSWLCCLLSSLGARIVGYALDPPTDPSLFSVACINELVSSFHGDICDQSALTSVFMNHMPDIVIHMAAQPIVRESYKNPVQTYHTNIMGTVHLLEAVRHCESVKSVVIVTTDKVYENREWEWGYRESDRLNGHDPYSNSKSCAELVTSSYKKSFLMNVAVSTCRAGNVIGGGDFAADRIIPDCFRAVESKSEISVRNESSVRPYQHVLEPLFAYLLVAEKQYYDKSKYEGIYNIGPDDKDCVTTGKLVNLFCEKWGESASWKTVSEDKAPHEAGFLKLDCSKAKSILKWKPVWNIDKAMDTTVEWSKEYLAGGRVRKIMEEQISEYLRDQCK